MLILYGLHLSCVCWKALLLISGPRCHVTKVGVCPFQENILDDRAAGYQHLALLWAFWGVAGNSFVLHMETLNYIPLFLDGLFSTTCYGRKWFKGMVRRSFRCLWAPWVGTRRTSTAWISIVSTTELCIACPNQEENNSYYNGTVANLPWACCNYTGEEARGFCFLSRCVFWNHVWYVLPENQTDKVGTTTS